MVGNSEAILGYLIRLLSKATDSWEQLSSNTCL